MSTTTPKKMEVGEELKAAVTQVTVPSKMTAAVLYGSEDLRIEKIDVPALAADEVLVRVRLALTDGTDLKVWKRGYHAKMIQPPAVFGHELVGEIVAVGKRVDPRWRIGMRVIAANSAPCLRCYHCRRGQAPTTCASPAASLSKTCWKCRTQWTIRALRWPSPWPACFAESMKWKCGREIPRR